MVLPSCYGLAGANLNVVLILNEYNSIVRETNGGSLVVANGYAGELAVLVGQVCILVGISILGGGNVLIVAALLFVVP